MGQKAVIVHGTKSNPGANWYPWLAEKLVGQGWQVVCPQFPTPQNQTIQAYWQVWLKMVGVVDQDSVLIGHSSGPNFILRVLESQTVPVRATFLVAPFVRENGDAEIDALNRNLWGGGFDWGKIKKASRKFFVYASDNDPYVPLKNSQEVADLLGVNLTLVPGAGHFSLSTNPKYFEFPKLLKDIGSVL